jgi:hypothetical protein
MSFTAFFCADFPEAHNDQQHGVRSPTPGLPLIGNKHAECINKLASALKRRMDFTGPIVINVTTNTHFVVDIISSPLTKNVHNSGKILLPALSLSMND